MKAYASHLLTVAGWDGPAVPPTAKRTIFQIGMAESNGEADMRGDIGDALPYVNSWGWLQIHCLAAEEGKGTDRDKWVALDPLLALKAALRISKNGTDFSPWTMFKNGKYSTITAVDKVLVWPVELLIRRQFMDFGAALSNELLAIRQGNLHLSEQLTNQIGQMRDLINGIPERTVTGLTNGVTIEHTDTYTMRTK